MRAMTATSTVECFEPLVHGAFDNDIALPTAITDIAEEGVSVKPHEMATWFPHERLTCTLLMGSNGRTLICYHCLGPRLFYCNELTALHPSCPTGVVFHAVYTEDIHDDDGGEACRRAPRVMIYDISWSGHKEPVPSNRYQALRQHYTQYIMPGSLVMVQWVGYTEAAMQIADNGDAHAITHVVGSIVQLGEDPWNLSVIKYVHDKIV